MTKLNIKFFAFTLFAMVLTSCKTNGKAKEEKIEVKEEINKVSNNNPVVKQNRFIDMNIDVQNIKSQLDGVTTTFLNKEERAFFPDRKNNKFYGLYNLIKDNGNGEELVGNLIIYDSINPYVYEKDTDQFIEIILNKEGIPLYEGNVKIGNTYSDILEYLGEPLNKKDDITIYQSGNKIGFFKFSNNKLSKIKIGIYRDSISPEEIINQVNW